MALPERKGHELVSAISGRKGIKMGIVIAAVLGILYAAVFAVESGKGQSSAPPENLQNVEEASPQESQNTMTPDEQQDADQSSFRTQFFAEISFASDPVSRGDLQTVTVTVYDGGYKLYRAPVEGTVTYADGTQKHFAGTTDATGEFAYSWRIEGDSAPGTFSVDVDVSSGGQSISEHSSFEVTL